MHSAKFVVGVARLVRREPCLWKCSRRNSDCCLPIASLIVIGEPLRETKRHGQIVRVFCLVGVARLELAALRSRTVRATKLRYTPLHIIGFYLPSFIRCAIFMFGSARFPSGLAFSIQTSVKLIAYAIYINLQIFATKLRQLSKKLYLDCVFLAEVDKIVCKMRIV